MGFAHKTEVQEDSPAGVIGVSPILFYFPHDWGTQEVEPEELYNKLTNYHRTAIISILK